MFYYCSKLTALDVSKFDTSNVTNMGSMFSACYSLTALDVSKFNTSNVTNMNSMFSGCGKLTALDVSNFDTSKVTNMGGMFNGCGKLTALDVSNFNTSNVTYMSSMFYGCSSLTALDASKFNTSNVTNMSKMFYNCSSLTAIDVSNFNTSNVTSMTSMFYQCRALTSVTGFAGKDIHSCTNVDGMFYDCDNIKDFDFSGANLSGVTDISTMFSSCNPESVSFKNANLSSVTDMSGMFSVQGGRLKTVDFSGCDLSKVTDIHNMFAFQTNLTAVNFSDKMRNVQNADSAFLNCSSLRNFPRFHFAGDSVNISRLCAVAGGSGAMIGELANYPNILGGTITSMDYAFTNQPNIQMIGLSGIGLTAAPTQAFAGCSGLEKVYTTQAENEYILAALNTDLPDKK